jgi:hypothetical protein
MRRAWIAIALLLVVVGCGVRKEDLVGTYTGTFSLTEEEKKNPATAFLDGLKPQLTLNENDTFVMDLMVKTEGSWRFEKGVVHLKPQTVMGIAIPEAQQKEIAFQVEDRGKTLKGVDPQGNVPITFTRQ